VESAGELGQKHLEAGDVVDGPEDDRQVCLRRQYALTTGRRELYTLYVQDGLDLSEKNKKRKDKKAI